MRRWMDIGPKWNTETTYRVRELLKEKMIPFRMPFDEAFFQSMYHLPHKDRIWGLKVRRKDLICVLSLLQKEGLIPAVFGGCQGDPDVPSRRSSRFYSRDSGKTGETQRQAFVDDNLLRI